MSAWQIIKFSLLGIMAYMFIGSLVLLAIAYLSAATGSHWFSERGTDGYGNRRNRWVTLQWGIFSPATVPFIWPILIPVGLAYFIGAGWKNLLETLGDKVIEAGVNREKRLRGISAENH